MKVAVCVKQVPVHDDGGMDIATGNIYRTGKAKINTNDLVALECALRMKEMSGASVDVFTMGPEKAKEALQTCYGYGVDGAVLVSDKEFGGADVLATAYTLYQAISYQGDYDIIICGAQTTDGDTGQVGGALSKWFERNYFNGVVQVEDVRKETINIVQLLEREEIRWNVKYPVVLSMDANAMVPRIPSLKSKLEGKKKKIETISHQEIGREEGYFGMHGSATKVKKIYTPPKEQKTELLFSQQVDAVQYIYDLLEEKRVL